MVWKLHISDAVNPFFKKPLSSEVKAVLGHKKTTSTTSADRVFEMVFARLAVFSVQGSQTAAVFYTASTSSWFAT